MHCSSLIIIRLLCSVLLVAGFKQFDGHMSVKITYSWSSAQFSGSIKDVERRLVDIL
jgi:hypothetical protein